MTLWQLTVRPLTGACIYVQVPNTATGLDVKKAIQQKDSTLHTHLQRLVGPGRTKLSDGCKLSESGVGHGSTLSLIILPPFNVHVQGVDGKMHIVTVPSSEPELYTVTALRVLVEGVLGHSLGEYQLHHQGRPVEESRHGRELQLRDLSIKNESTLVLIKMGLLLNITNPKVDVCFLVDCTGSMGGHITSVKSNIQQLREKLIAEYSKCDLVFAFVRYTDYDVPQRTRTSYLNFTNNSVSFRSFVGAIVADGGGGDGPEDVMGGLRVALLRLSWRPDACKIIIHIGDCPCHGRKYHSMPGDFYPNGDPAGTTHESMMAEVARLDIQYWFGYINKADTDQMIRVFNDSLRVQSKQHLLIRQFDAMQPSEVGEAVKEAVIASVYGSAALKTAAADNFKLDPNVPDWSSHMIPQQAAKRTPPPAVTRLSSLQHGELVLEEPSVNFSFKIAPNPFAEGSECLVYHASDLTNLRRVVLKRFKRCGKDFNTLQSYMKKLEVRTIATVYASEFSQDKLKPPGTCSVEFAPLDVVRCPGSMFYTLEPFLGGRIIKFNNNRGVVSRSSPLSDLMQAFSHYSWVKSGKTLLICDLQGFREEGRGEQVVLTDPAIHSRTSSGRFGVMDAGMTGVVAFFQTHTCSAVCRQMNLEGHGI